MRDRYVSNSMELRKSTCKEITRFSNVSRSVADRMDSDRTACRFCCLPAQHHFPFYQNNCPLLFCGLHRSDFRILWRYLLSVSEKCASQRILYKCTITTRNPKGGLAGGDGEKWFVLPDIEKIQILRIYVFSESGFFIFTRNCFLYISHDPDGILTRSFCPSFSTIVSTGICFFLNACTTEYPANI